MERWLGVGFGALAVLLVGWNTYTLRSIDARIDALEEGPRAAPAQAERGPTTRQALGLLRSTPAAGAVARATGDREPVTESGTPEELLEDPELQDRIVEMVREREEEERQLRRDERTANFLESVNSEVEEFAATHDLDDQTTGKILAEVQLRHEAWETIRADQRSGNMSWFDARREFQDVRDDSDAALAELLGDDLATDLNTQLWGDWRR